MEGTLLWEADTLAPKFALQLKLCVISSLTIHETKGWTPRCLGAFSMLTSQEAVWSQPHSHSRLWTQSCV